MSIHRYRMTGLLTDGLRAVFGLTMTFGPLCFLDPVWPLNLILGGLGGVFSMFALKLVYQSLSPIELSQDGISRHGPMATGLAWSDMTSLKLAHYAAPRRSSTGWYELKLGSQDARLKVDSTIEGFEKIVAASVGAAMTGGLTLDPATTDNLRGLGHDSGRLTAAD